jgi:hypothetical protein
VEKLFHFDSSSLYIVVHRSVSSSSSFPDDIGTSLRTHPHLMHLLSIDIDSRSRAKGFLLGLLVLGIRDCQVSLRDEMCGQSVVSVWRVVSVSAMQSGKLSSSLNREHQDSALTGHRSK